MDNAKLRVTMPDGSRWDVPVMAVARNRATHYASEYGGDVERSLKEDTLRLFMEDEGEISDWAANSMNWEDVEDQAVKVSDDPQPVDFQEGWVNGDKEIVKD